MDLKIREFETTLRRYINETDLPPEVKRLVLKGIVADAEADAANTIRCQIEERDSQGKEVEEYEEDIQ